MSRLTVNGRPVQFDMDPATPLLWALRDAANLTGTKYGCGVGDCGACTVLVDGQALRACLISLSEAEGRFVMTVEGLSHDRTHPVQQALVAEQAIQCGFCTPGIVMGAAALLQGNAAPSDQEIRDAVQRAGRIMRGEEVTAAVPAPGTSHRRAARAVPAMEPVPPPRQSDAEN